MKPLADQLEEWLEVGVVREIQQEIPQRKPESLIAGGKMKWKPVDRQAAMLLAKAQDICKWHGEPKKVKENVAMNEATTNRGGTEYTNPALVQKGGAEFVNVDKLTESVIERILKSQPQHLQEMAKAALTAREVLRENLRELCSGQESFETKSSEALKSIRDIRTAVIGEVHKFSSELRDLRQFFVGPSYEQEITRLKEFVGLCEKIKALKQDGTLDAVADTIIKLSK